MVRHIGILLRTTVEQQPTYFLLDKEDGKISAASGRFDISRGSLMAYSLEHRRTKTYVHGIDLLDLPNINSVDELIFFHQVLELSYYFLPLGKAVPDIFYLLLFLYVSLERLHTNGLKKLFLFKLFAHLGFYPDDQTAYFPLFHTVRTQSIDTIIHGPVDLSLERKLDRWLDYCISLHPCTDYFKVISLFMSRKP